jgi:hypothetical protein
MQAEAKRTPGPFLPRVSPDDHKDRFPANRKEALEKAHDLRKFEIELYWKRATYFWTIIALAFAGFFAASNASDLSNSYVIACLGFTFSFGWYLVNRASSAVQRNWDLHVRLLEDGVTGPLHKWFLHEKQYSLTDIPGPYRYSISKLNATLSFTVTLSWLGLLGKTAVQIYRANGGWTTAIAFSVIAALATLFMLLFCAPRTPDEERTIFGEAIKYK